MEENVKDYKIGKWERSKKRGNSSKSKDSKGKKESSLGEKILALKKNKGLKIGNVKLRSQLKAFVDGGGRGEDGR